MRRERAGLATSTARAASTALVATLALALGLAFSAASSSCGGDSPAADDPIGLPDREEPDGARTDAGDGGADAALADSRAPGCDLAKPFATPTRLTELDEATPRSTPRLSADELSLYFTTRGDSGTTGADLGVVTRMSKAAPFGSEKILDQSGAASDNDPSVSLDHLELFFHSGRNGTADIFTSTRASTSVPFGDAGILGPAVNGTMTNENQPYYRAAGGELWFISDRPGGAGLYDIYVSTKTSGAFALPTRVVELSSPSEDWQPQPSNDGLTVVFASDRPNGLGKLDLWIARRASTAVPFGIPTAMTELNSAFTEQAGWLSADGCRIWFSSGRNTNDLGSSLFFAERPKR